MTKTQNQYEAMFLLPAGASAEMEKSLAMVRGMIERHEGQVLVLKKWDERRLAYELEEAEARAVHHRLLQRARSGTMAQIERDVSLSELFLRVLITHADHLSRSRRWRPSSRSRSWSAA
jgi:small subunit ribosomal protein S6